MPIYPYVCSSCGHEFDLLQKVSDDPLRQCPDCGEDSLRKKLTAAAFHLKGTGWYETDFKNKGAAKDKEEKGDQKAGHKEGGKDAAKGSTEGKKDDATASDKKPTAKTTNASSSQSNKSESKKTDSNQ